MIQSVLAIEIDDPNYKKLIRELLDSYESRNDVKAEELMTNLHEKLPELKYFNDDMIFSKIGISSNNILVLIYDFPFSISIILPPDLILCTHSSINTFTEFII